MSANNTRRSNFLGYDLFKLVVALILLIILILLLLRGCGGTSVVAGVTQEATTPHTETPQPEQVATATQAAGGTNTPSAVAPVITVPRNDEGLQGPTIRILGTAQPGSDVEILDNGKRLGTAKADDKGRWVFEGPIAPGTHTFEATVGDGSLKSKPVTVTILVTPTPSPIPTAAPSTPTPQIASGGANCDGLISGYLLDEEHYVVGSCDTLSGIAVWLNVTVESLLESNPQITDPDTIIPGQIVNVPPG